MWHCKVDIFIFECNVSAAATFHFPLRMNYSFGGLLFFHLMPSLKFELIKLEFICEDSYMGDIMPVKHHRVNITGMLGY